MKKIYLFILTVLFLQTAYTQSSIGGDGSEHSDPTVAPCTINAGGDAKICLGDTFSLKGSFGTTSGGNIGIPFWELITTNPLGLQANIQFPNQWITPVQFSNTGTYWFKISALCNDTLIMDTVSVYVGNYNFNVSAGPDQIGCNSITLNGTPPGPNQSSFWEILQISQTENPYVIIPSNLNQPNLTITAKPYPQSYNLNKNCEKIKLKYTLRDGTCEKYDTVEISLIHQTKAKITNYYNNNAYCIDSCNGKFQIILKGNYPGCKQGTVNIQTQWHVIEAKDCSGNNILNLVTLIPSTTQNYADFRTPHAGYYKIVNCHTYSQLCENSCDTIGIYIYPSPDTVLTGGFNYIFCDENPDSIIIKYEDLYSAGRGDRGCGSNLIPITLSPGDITWNPYMPSGASYYFNSNGDAIIKIDYSIFNVNETISFYGYYCGMADSFICNGTKIGLNCCSSKAFTIELGPYLKVKDRTNLCTNDPISFRKLITYSGSIMIRVVDKPACDNYFTINQTLFNLNATYYLCNDTFKFRAIVTKFVNGATCIDSADFCIIVLSPPCANSAGTDANFCFVNQPFQLSGSLPCNTQTQIRWRQIDNLPPITFSDKTIRNPKISGLKPGKCYLFEYRHFYDSLSCYIADTIKVCADSCNFNDSIWCGNTMIDPNNPNQVLITINVLSNNPLPETNYKIFALNGSITWQSNAPLQYGYNTLTGIFIPNNPSSEEACFYGFIGNELLDTICCDIPATSNCELTIFNFKFPDCYSLTNTNSVKLQYFYGYTSGNPSLTVSAEGNTPFSVNNIQPNFILDGVNDLFFDINYTGPNPPPPGKIFASFKITITNGNEICEAIISDSLSFCDTCNTDKLRLDSIVCAGYDTTEGKWKYKVYASFYANASAQYFYQVTGSTTGIFAPTSKQSTSSNANKWKQFNFTYWDNDDNSSYAEMNIKVWKFTSSGTPYINSKICGSVPECGCELSNYTLSYYPPCLDGKIILTLCFDYNGKPGIWDFHLLNSPDFFQANVFPDPVINQGHNCIEQMISYGGSTDVDSATVRFAFGNFPDGCSIVDSITLKPCPPCDSISLDILDIACKSVQNGQYVYRVKLKTTTKLSTKVPFKMEDVNGTIIGALPDSVSDGQIIEFDFIPNPGETQFSIGEAFVNYCSFWDAKDLPICNCTLDIVDVTVGSFPNHTENGIYVVELYVKVLYDGPAGSQGKAFLMPGSWYNPLLPPGGPSQNIWIHNPMFTLQPGMNDIYLKIKSNKLIYQVEFRIQDVSSPDSCYADSCRGILTCGGRCHPEVCDTSCRLSPRIAACLSDNLNCDPCDPLKGGTLYVTDDFGVILDERNFDISWSNGTRGVSTKVYGKGIYEAFITDKNTLCRYYVKYEVSCCRPPTNIGCTRTSYSVTLKWEKNPEATKYGIEVIKNHKNCCPNGTGTYSVIHYTYGNQKQYNYSTYGNCFAFRIISYCPEGKLSESPWYCFQKTSGCALMNYNPRLMDDITNDSYEIAIYPNPNNGQFIIEGSLLEITQKIVVSDVLGRDVLVLDNLEDVRNELNLNISAGSYFLRLLDNENNLIHIEQVEVIR